MKSLPLLCALPLLVGTALANQEGWPVPANELDVFTPYLGHWEGTGTLRRSPDSEPTSWTARNHTRKFLGGFWILEEMTIEMEGFPTPVEMRTICGWDAENQKLVRCSVGSMGHGGVTELAHIDGALVSVSAIFKQGVHLSDRVIWRAGKDSWSITLERGFNAGETFQYGEGTFRRIEAKNEATPVDAASSATPLKPEMAGAKPLLGNHRVDGWIIPMPGLPRMDIGAVEKNRSILGGNAIESLVVGDPMPGMEGSFEAFSYFWWAEEKQCFISAWFDSMGAAEISECRPADENTWVMTRAGMLMGQPMVDRSVLTFADGGMSSVYTDRMVGTDEPQRVFKAKYSAIE